jgi:hypothetical protein
MSFGTVLSGIYWQPMKNPSSNKVLTFFLSALCAAQVAAQPSDVLLKRCAADYIDSIRISRNPSLLLNREKTEEAIQNHINQKTNSFRIASDVIVTIPVVVHVVHNRRDHQIGGANNSNISDEQIASQMDVLNEDYGNTSGYRGFYTESHAVDTGIRFRLAGIVRTYDARQSFSVLTADQQLVKTSPPWATNKYLNIWVCELSTEYLGVAQSPTVTEINPQTNGLFTTEEEGVDPLTDGVIIGWRYFGRNQPSVTSSFYNLGRTTTHEIGHWLGLIHIWGRSICGTDYCDDTPRAENSYLPATPVCEEVFSNCEGKPSRNMIENYMDYSPDRCMSVFTNDQKKRMHAVLAVSPRRSQLVAYASRADRKLTVEVFPNPVGDYLNAQVYTPDYSDFRLTVLNDQGAEVIRETHNQTYINVKSLPTGVYILRVTAGNETVSKRLLVR